MTGIDNNTLFERYPTNNHAQMIVIMSAVERLINEHDNAVSPSGYILLAADERLNKVYIPYGFQDASRRQGSESPGA